MTHLIEGNNMDCPDGIFRESFEPRGHNPIDNSETRSLPRNPSDRDTGVAARGNDSAFDPEIACLR